MEEAEELRASGDNDGFFLFKSACGAALERFRERTGYDEYEYDVVKFRADCRKYDTGFLKQTMEQTIYTLADGDIRKLEYAKKMKITEASKIMLIKEINAFKEWYQAEVLKGD